MGERKEILKKFEEYACLEAARLNNCSKEILEVERLIDKCPSLWGRSIHFDETKISLSAVEGRLFMECDGNKKPLIEFRVKERLIGYHYLYKFLELLMEGQG